MLGVSGQASGPIASELKSEKVAVANMLTDYDEALRTWNKDDLKGSLLLGNPMHPTLGPLYLKL